MPALLVRIFVGLATKPRDLALVYGEIDSVDSAWQSPATVVRAFDCWNRMANQWLEGVVCDLQLPQILSRVIYRFIYIYKVRSFTFNF